MSQNKTVVPGMGGAPSPGNREGNNFYSRGTNRMGNPSNGTVVAGMEQCAPGTTPKQPADNNASPVVGFLYSISRQGIGEFWPLHIGSNLIGSSPDCDICLREGTVSSEHAMLVVRKMKNTDKVIASIKDDSSKNGTLVNGEDMGFSAQECFNGDIITVGSNYELLLVLIDAKAIGLKVAENFISLPDEDELIIPSDVSGGYDYNNFNPYDHNSRPTDGGTVAMDGSNPINPGGTKFM